MHQRPSPVAAVLGAGSWGTALAMLLARNGAQIRLWDRDPQHIAALCRQRSNERYLPGISFPARLTPVADLGEALADCDAVLVAVPSAGFRSVLSRFTEMCGGGIDLVWATKGLEPCTGRFLHEVAAQELPHDTPRALLSGPSFASEVARGLPTAVTVASADSAYAQRIANLFHCPEFRTYTCDDVIGVELGGAVKNVLAIAAGISDGLGYGSNARAALITRGLAETMRLGLRLDGRQETFMGLAGVGDLVLTCTDDQSRNRRLGLALGQGKPLAEAVAQIGQAVEGLDTAQVLDALARSKCVEMPITEQVKRVLCDGEAPATAVQTLLKRDPRPEGV
jgi:glycerol-3-phosphate dehydrogenase (NAD(P)+)